MVLRIRRGPAHGCRLTLQPRISPLGRLLLALLILGGFQEETRACNAQASASPTRRDLGTNTARMWEPTEWRLPAAAAPGNPFDVRARAIFVHEASGATRTTGMFYDGDGHWAFRFTGTQPGRWRVRTESGVADLDGHHGSVHVTPHPDQRREGFLTHVGNRFAIHRGNAGRLEGYLFTVYMNNVEHPTRVPQLGSHADTVRARTRAYVHDALANGTEIVFLAVNNNWFSLGSESHHEHRSRDPDLRTFEVLETVISTAHEMGGRVHLWAWGDESRRMTPIGVGGINGEADRRLQRYIAARLGPLPGWSMGYGFDLHEWTTPTELESWAAYLHREMGWPHLLAARGSKLTESAPNLISYDGMGRAVEVSAATRHGPRSYREVLDALRTDTTQPHLYEERHTYLRPGFQLDMTGTRRLLWWQAMAGGMGGFIGFYPETARAFQGHPYPNPEQLQTHYRFWHGNDRFGLDLVVDGEISSTGHALRSADRRRYVIYVEDTDAVEVDLSEMPGPRPAVAVNTAAEYHEIDLGLLTPGRQTVRLPGPSDWAIAVGP